MPVSLSVFTNDGLTALASAVQGNYAAPLYLVLENNGSTFATSSIAGVTSVTLNAPVHLSGDSQLVLGAGLASQEVVTFTAATGAGPTTYTLSAATTQPHTSGDPACRVPLVSDTMASVVNEVQYNPSFDPSQRVQSVSGYSTGVGQWTMQFFVSGIEASSFLMTGGISDSPNIGSGKLHAHFILGVNHVFNPVSGGVDLEIDVPIQV